MFMRLRKKEGLTRKTSSNGSSKIVRLQVKRNSKEEDKMSLKDELPKGPSTTQSVSIILIGVLFFVGVIMFMLSSCSHEISSMIGSPEENISLGFSVELLHTKDKEKK